MAICYLLDTIWSTGYSGRKGKILDATEYRICTGGKLKLFAVVANQWQTLTT
jgi:hypothetical protein